MAENENVISFAQAENKAKELGLQAFEDSMSKLIEIHKSGVLSGLFAIVFTKAGDAKIVYGGDMSPAYLMYALEYAKDEIKRL